MMHSLIQYKFEVFFSALLVYLVYPFISLTFGISLKVASLIFFSVLVFASFNLATQKKTKIGIIFFGIIASLTSCLSYYLNILDLFEIIGVYSRCFFYLTLVFILINSFLQSTQINFKTVIGVVSGYLLLGFLGASIFEVMQLHFPSSFQFSNFESFDYIYFSFVTLLTIGYGDIVPLTQSAKAITILISLIGQLYIAVGITSSVAKFLNKKQ